MGLAFGEEGVDRAGGGGSGHKGRPDFATGVISQDGYEDHDHQQDEHDAVGVGAVARIAEEVLAFVDVHLLIECPRDQGTGVAVGPVTRVGVGAGVAVGGLRRFSSQILIISPALKTPSGLSATFWSSASASVTASLQRLMRAKASP